MNTILSNPTVDHLRTNHTRNSYAGGTAIANFLYEEVGCSAMALVGAFFVKTNLVDNDRHSLRESEGV